MVFLDQSLHPDKLTLRKPGMPGQRDERLDPEFRLALG
jgi:hypothetical protein